VSKIYKFFGEPLKEVKGAQSGLVIFRFDSKGEFITDDQKIIDRTIGHFDHITLEAKEIGERVKKTITVPPIQITTNEPHTERKEEISGEKFLCKYCGEAFEKAGQRLAHYSHGCPKKED
jgi:hypothetical protein